MSSGLEIFPEVTGTLKERSPADLITLIEQKRITGVLEAHDGPRRFELILRGGEIESAEATEDPEDPVSSFLNLEKGRYRLRQQLLLPNGELSDQRVATGTIEEFNTIDLVQSCEQGGLHGTLRVKCGGRLVEVLFDGGLLTTITLDGHQDVDVQDMWEWTTGEWAILALPALEPAPDPSDSGMDFLKDFEVAAVNFISDAQQKTDATWGLEDSRELLLIPDAKPVDSTQEGVEPARPILDERPPNDAPVIEATVEPRQKRPDERTVRVVYYDTAKPSEDPTPLPSRYSDADVTSVFIYKRPKQKIIVENSTCQERDTRPLEGEIVSLAEMSNQQESSKDPIELAFAPAPKRVSRPTDFRPLPQKKRRGPWATIIVTLVLLSLIGLLLYLISFLPAEGG